MRVRATARGYDNITIREPGDEFDMPDGMKGSWFEPIAKAPPPVSKKDDGKKDKSSGSDLV